MNEPSIAGKGATSAVAGNRERLERAALDAVRRAGLKGLSFRTLAEAIGVKSSSVHYHFPGKGDLARTLIERYSESFAGSLAAISARGTSPRAQLAAFIDLFATAADAERLCLCGMLAAEIDQLDAANRTRLRAYFENTEHWLETLFEDNRDALATPLPSPILARTLMAGLEGALLLDRPGDGDAHLAAQRALALSWTCEAG